MGNERYNPDFPRKSKRKPSLPASPNGRHIPVEIKNKILELLEPDDEQMVMSYSEIARICRVTPECVRQYVSKDPELKARRDEAWELALDAVEESMVQRAIGGRNEIAAQQAGEFILRHRRRKVYDDSFVSEDRLNALPKIVVQMTIPARQQVKTAGDIVDGKNEVIDV